MDAEQRIYYSSPLDKTLSGIPLPMNGGKLTGERIHPDDYANVINVFKNSFRTNTPFSIEFRLQHRDGHWLWVEMRGVPVLDAGHNVVRCVMVSRDITERKATEEALKHSERLVAIGELAASIAHEIRNPLTVIRGFLQLEYADSVHLHNHLPMILSELDRVETIIKEFLHMAKPGRTEFKRQNLDTLLSETARLVESQAIFSNVNIRIEEANRLPSVLCHENHLKQVFLNLLKNAIDAMPGGGTIYVKTDVSDGNNVMIRIADDGVGIPDSVLERIGKPFNTTKSEGTGLGLMVCQQIIEAHGGTFHIGRGDNIGTEVIISLPIESESVQGTGIKVTSA